MPTSIHLHRTTDSFTSLHHHKQPLLIPSFIPEDALVYHSHRVGPNQCTSAVVQLITAPLHAVWSLVRRFDDPLSYKHFLRSCHVISGSGVHVGSVREVHVISGIPATSSTERLEILDDERHVISFCVLGGKHRLNNYRSVTSLHRSADGNGTLVVESYLVDVPAENTIEETCMFVDTIVRCNLQALARITENSTRNNYCNYWLE